MHKKIIIQAVMIFTIIACGANDKIEESWIKDPKVSLILNNKPLGENGFADDIDIEVQGIPVGYDYAFFLNDNTCSIPSSKIKDGVSAGTISVDDIDLEVGVNEFYVGIVALETDANGDRISFCFHAGSYYKVDLNLTLIPLEGALKVSWSIDQNINIKSAKISMDGGVTKTNVYNGYIISDLDLVLTTVDLELVDETGFAITKTSFATPNAINPAPGTFLKASANEALMPSGFAEMGRLRVFSNGDKIGIYRDSTCTTNVNADRIVNSYYDFNLSFTIGPNNFYIKRIPKGNVFKSSCSSAISYTRGDLSLTLTSVEAGIVATFSATYGINASYVARVNSGNASAVTSPHEFGGLSSISHEITIIAKDENNIILTTKASAIPFSLMPATIFLEKEMGVPFMSNPGFSGNGMIKVTGINVGDIVGVYSDAACTSIVGSNIISVANSAYFNVPFAVGVNTFYAKRQTGLSQICSAAVTYTRSSLIVNAARDGLNITGSWTLSYLIYNVNYLVGIDSLPLEVPVGNSHVFSGLNEGVHTLIVQATDLDSFPASNMVIVPAIPLIIPTIELLRSDSNSFMSNPGFSSTGIIRVNNYRVGDVLELYRNNNCSGVSIENLTSASTPANFNVTLSDGINNFSVKRNVGGSTVCSNAVNYVKSTIDLTLTSGELEITANWILSNPVNATYNIKIDGEPFVPATDTHTFNNVSSSTHQVTLQALDLDGAIISVVKSMIPDNMAKATASIFKNNSDVAFNSNPGLATAAVIKVTDFTVGDTLAVYRDYTCSSVVAAADVITGSHPAYINVTLNPENNVFYVKRSNGPSSSCSNPVSYYKSSINLNLTPIELGITADWYLSRGITGATANIKLDANQSIPMTGATHTFDNVSAASHQITVTVTDLDGFGDSTLGSGTPLGLTKVTVSLSTKSYNNFISNPGYSVEGYVTVSGYTTGDKLEVFKAPNCTGTPIITVNTLDAGIRYLAVPFSAGVNNFYVRRTYFANNSMNTCSDVVSYTREVMTPQVVTLRSFRDQMTGNWERPNNIVPGSNYMISFSNSIGVITQGEIADSVGASQLTQNMVGLRDDHGLITQKNDLYSVEIKIKDQDGANIPFVTTPPKQWEPVYIDLYTTGHFKNGSLPSYVDPFSGKVGPVGFGMFVAGIQELGGTAVYTFYNKDVPEFQRVYPYTYNNISGIINSFAGLTPEGRIYQGEINGFADTTQVYVPDAPAGDGFKAIVGGYYAYAALHTNKTISVWGNVAYGGRQSDVPALNDYEAIAANPLAFAALRSNGGVVTWGPAAYGGSNRPSITGFKSIRGVSDSFIGLHTNGSVHFWQKDKNDVIISGMESGCQAITASTVAFSCLKAGGSVVSWYSDNATNYGNPPGAFAVVAGASESFAGIRLDGSIYSWGKPSEIANSPSGTGYTFITSNYYGAYAALTNDKKIKAWGEADAGGVGAPTDSGYIKIVAMAKDFAALKEDGTIVNWGNGETGFGGPP